MRIYVDVPEEALALKVTLVQDGDEINVIGEHGTDRRLLGFFSVNSNQKLHFTQMRDIWWGN